MRGYPYILVLNYTKIPVLGGTALMDFSNCYHHRASDRVRGKKFKLCRIWGTNCAVKNIDCAGLRNVVTNKKGPC